MKKQVFSFLLIFSTILCFAQPWQTVIDDSPYNNRTFIYEKSNQENLLVIGDHLHTIDIDGNLISKTNVAWGNGRYKNIHFNSGSIYSVFKDTSNVSSIRVFDHAGLFIDSIFIHGPGFSIFEFILNEDGSFTTLTYEGSTSQMHAKKYDSNGNELISSILGSSGTRPRSLHKMPDGKFIATDASGNYNLYFLDADLNIIARPSLVGHIIQDLVITDAGRIFVAGLLGNAFTDHTFIAEIDTEGEIINEYTFSENDFPGGNGWVQNLSSVIFNPALLVSSPETNNIANLICFDDELNVLSINTFEGDRNQVGMGSNTYAISQMVPNQIGGYTLAHGIKYNSGENYPLVIKTDDNCFVDTDVVLALEEVNLEAERKEQSVLLSWDLSVETEIKAIEIEHGNTSNDFSLLKKLELENGSQYMVSFMHDHPFVGDNYYRLKIILEEDKLLYSKMKFVKIDNKDINIYPNPSSDNITLSIKKEINAISIYDILGNKVMDKKITSESDKEINIEDLAPGKYLLQALHNNQINQVGFIKIEF